MQINKLKGLIAATFTPMKPDGAINPGIILDYAQKLKSDGIKGVFVCGTTGEGMSLTTEERKIIAELWITEQTKDFKVIIHVGTTSAKQSHELAAQAQQAGAFAVGCIGPLVFKPTRMEELVGFCGQVAAGAPELPFYYYHIPAVSGIRLSMSAFIKLASSQIKNFAGIKFTDNNFVEFQQCLNLDDGKWDILNGYDEVLLAGLCFGAKGAVGSTYNFMAPLYHDIMADFENGRIESARKSQMTAVKMIDILNRYGGALVSGKALMKVLGIDCGHFRSPVARFNDGLIDDFLADLKHEGFFTINKMSGIW